MRKRSAPLPTRDDSPRRFAVRIERIADRAAYAAPLDGTKGAKRTVYGLGRPKWLVNTPCGPWSSPGSQSSRVAIRRIVSEWVLDGCVIRHADGFKL
jgi:hypothetical protein